MAGGLSGLAAVLGVVDCPTPVLAIWVVIGVGWSRAPADIRMPTQTRAATTPEVAPINHGLTASPRNQRPTPRAGTGVGAGGLERTSDGCLHSRSSGGSQGVEGPSSSSSPG